MVSPAQLSALLDFVEEHPEMARGYQTRSIEGRTKSARLWSECAKTLNGLSPDGMVKPGESWRTYFNEFKSRTLRRIKIMKEVMAVTGGGPSKKLSLTSCQTRLYKVLGRDVTELVPEARQNPTVKIEVQQIHEDSQSSLPIFVYPDIRAEEDSSATADIQSLSPQRSPPTEAEVSQPRRRRWRREPRSQVATDLDPALRSLIAMKRRTAAAKLEQAAALREKASAVREQASAISEHAQAVRDHAAAINRLAASIETIGPHLINVNNQ